MTLDMAYSMKLIVKRCFPKSVQVTDRFHVQKISLRCFTRYPYKTSLESHRPRKQPNKRS
ncbi:transposase [Tenacibaculum maritimum]|uniref:transposase n=1 Tax=Tenacibaculum maritimum TaxID=107401 RepID=UPI0038783CEA